MVSGLGTHTNETNEHTKGVTVSRFDKTHSAVGIHRAPLNIALTATSGPAGVTDLNRILVVGLNGSGRVIKATSAITATGIIIATRAMAAGDPIDVMSFGEVVELDSLDLQSGSPAAGTHYILDTTASRLAAIGAPAAGTNVFRVGWTVEASRLIVRCGMVQG